MSTKNARMLTRSGTKATLAAVDLMEKEIGVASDTQQIFMNTGGTLKTVCPDINSLSTVEVIRDADVLIVAQPGNSPANEQKVTIESLVNHSVKGGEIHYSLQGGANWSKVNFRPVRLPLARFKDAAGVEVFPPYGLDLDESPYTGDDNQLYTFYYGDDGNLSTAGILGLGLGVGEVILPFQNTFQSYDGLMSSVSNSFPTTSAVSNKLQAGVTVNRWTVKTNADITMPTYSDIKHAIVFLILNTGESTITITMPASDSGKDIVSNLGNTTIVTISMGALREIHWASFDEIITGRECYSIMVSGEMFVVT